MVATGAINSRYIIKKNGCGCLDMNKMLNRFAHACGCLALMISGRGGTLVALDINKVFL
jgi:hypothetical protein